MRVSWRMRLERCRYRVCYSLLYSLYECKYKPLPGFTTGCGDRHIGLFALTFVPQAPCEHCQAVLNLMMSAEHSLGCDLNIHKTYRRQQALGQTSVDPIEFLSKTLISARRPDHFSAAIESAAGHRVRGL